MAEPTIAQKALTLHPKTAAGGIAGSLSVVALYVLGAVWGIEPPPEVCAEITVAVTGIAAWLAPKLP